MGAIEDFRKIAQDLIAPDLKAIGVRLDTLEKRIDGLEQRFDKRFDTLEQRMEQRFNEVLTAVQYLIRFSALEQRIERIEQQKLPSNQ